MQNVALAANNALGVTNNDSSSTLYGDADASFPLANLKNTTLPSIWRYTPGANADGTTTKFAVNLLTGPVRTNHFVLARHNLGNGAQIRVRAGTARFDADFTTDNPFTHDITFGGGANGTRTNEYGVMVAGSCPRYEHDRRFPENAFAWSEDLTNAVWAIVRGRKTGNIVELEPEVGGGFGGQFGQGVISSLYPDTYEIRAYVRLLEGDGTLRMQIQDAWSTGYTLGSTQVVTSEWGWVTWTCAFPFTQAAFPSLNVGWLEKRNARGVFEFKRLQFRRGSGGGKYRKITSQRRYQRIGAVVESAATNSLLRSSELTTAPWQVLLSTVAANQATAPDGTVAMDRLTVTSAGGKVYQTMSFGGTRAGASSVFFRADNNAVPLARLVMYWHTGGVLQSITCNFNPRTGAFVSSSTIGAPTFRAAGVRDCGGGFFRAYVMGVGTDAANTIHQVEVASDNLGYVDLWGFQNEASYVTTYIPTAGAAVTRTQDTAEVETATWVPYVLNGSDGTMYHEWQAEEIPSDVSRTASACFIYNSATPTNNLYSEANYTSGVGWRSFGVMNSGALWDSGGRLVSASGGGVGRAVIRFRSGDLALHVNGFQQSTSAATLSTGWNRVDLMRGASVTHYLRRVGLWQVGKDNATGLSASTSGPGAIDYDSGWGDALQVSLEDVQSNWGFDYDVQRFFPTRAVEWVRVELYDPSKTLSTSTFDVGRAFMGKMILQPECNASYGLGNQWKDRTLVEEAFDGREFFQERPEYRETVFSFEYLTAPEQRVTHEMMSRGTASEVMFIPDADDLAECQRYGFLGRMKDLDRLTYTNFAIGEAAFQLRQRR